MVAVLVGGWFALQATVFAPKPVEVRVASVERGRVESTITNTRAGTVKAKRRAQLSPEINGRVVALAFREGERVAAGEVVLRMDDTSQGARLDLARRSLETVQALYDETVVMAERSEREHERYRKTGERLISQDQLDQLAAKRHAAAAARATAGARVEQARAEIAVVEAELAKTLLRAPFDGVLGEVSVELGEFIMPSPPGVPIPAVLDLIDTTSIYISAPMDEVDSSVVETGQVVRVTLDPYPDRAFSGRVTRIAPYVLDIELQNRTVEIEVSLDDHEFATGLLPGTSADVEVILETREHAIRVPTSSLLVGGRVLVLENGTIHERVVEVGLRNWDWSEILSGLDEGDSVVNSLGDPAVKPGIDAVRLEP